ncbi:hypothetical protein [Aeromicrobium sp. 179-A 4D2 NHS]|uniref:hypothetical protein n=1 Tax=Aeromicrobium sp. 179-A 4D2 NHS TaxID=3142375 RepID=UPI00399F2188
MTDPKSSPDDFDRIVEGLELDLTGLDDFDDAAARAAAARERAELEEQQRREAEPDEDPAEQFYRQVGPADLRADPRTRLAWFVVIGGPAVLLLASMASLRPPAPVVGLVIAAAVAGVVYLIARLPDRGPSNPDWPDDGAAL